MPRDFDICVQKGGHVRTIKAGPNHYMHVCILNGKWHKGTIKKLKKKPASTPSSET